MFFSYINPGDDRCAIVVAVVLQLEPGRLNVEHFISELKTDCRRLVAWIVTEYGIGAARESLLHNLNVQSGEEFAGNCCWDDDLR